MVRLAATATALLAGGAAAARNSTAGAAPPAVDRWLLDGHGTGRALFASAQGNWVVSAPAAAAGCTQLRFYTPFSSYEVFSGLGVRDAPGQPPLLAVPLACGGQGGMWVVDPIAAATVTFGALSGAATLNSYAKFLPDGTVAVGTMGTAGGAALSVYDPATLAPVYANSAVAGGGGGVQVIAVTKPAGAGQPSQIQMAGGTGGPNWWGVAADLPATGPSFPFANIARNADTTVCMGADGRSMFNNQRFEDPQGVVRFLMPLPSSPEPYNTGYQNWPWQMRSTFDGRVAALSENVLTLYSGAAGHAPLWSVRDLDNDGPATLFWSDDEALVVYVNGSRLVSLDAATGAVVADVDLVGDTCVAQQSPWSIPSPAPTGSGVVVLVCAANGGGGNYVVNVDASTGQMVRSAAPLSVTPDQLLVDAAGGLLVVGTSTADKTLAIQRVAPLLA